MKRLKQTLSTQQEASTCRILVIGSDDGNKNAPGFIKRFCLYRPTLLARIDSKIITMHIVLNNFTVRQFTPAQEILI